MHLADLLWATVAAFFMIVYFMMLFVVILDVFRSWDLSGLAKAAWLLALILVPLISLLVYVIARGAGMPTREEGRGAPADEIASAHALLQAQAISEQEYRTLKSNALA